MDQARSRRGTSIPHHPVTQFGDNLTGRRIPQAVIHVVSNIANATRVNLLAHYAESEPSLVRICCNTALVRHVPHDGAPSADRNKDVPSETQNPARPWRSFRLNRPSMSNTSKRSMIRSTRAQIPLASCQLLLRAQTHPLRRWPRPTTTRAMQTCQSTRCSLGQGEGIFKIVAGQTRGFLMRDFSTVCPRYLSRIRQKASHSRAVSQHWPIEPLLPSLTVRRFQSPYLTHDLSR